eukprot:3812602-Prymnesium_polylepis.1
MVPVVVRRSVVTKRGAVERQQPADVADCEGGHTRQAQVVDLHARVLHIRLEQGVVHVENEAVAWHERAAGAEDEELLSEGVALEGDVVGGEAHRLLHPVMQLVEPRVEPLVAVEGAVRAEEVGVPEERERQERAEKGAPAGRRRSQREDSIDEVREKNRRLASGHVCWADEPAPLRRLAAWLQLALTKCAVEVGADEAVECELKDNAEADIGRRVRTPHLQAMLLRERFADGAAPRCGQQKRSRGRADEELWMLA